MTIIFNQSFKKSLQHILIFIAQDKPSASVKFNRELKKIIKSLSENPLRYKVSTYMNDVNVREMTYQGYTIIYEVSPNKETIEILTIFNRNKP